MRRHFQALDAAIGARIRAARVAARVSQTVLGDALGVSFQQVQKYELGKDRTPASSLQRIAEELGVPVMTFFTDDAVPVGEVHDVRESMRVGAEWQRIRNSIMRRQVAAFISALAREDEAERGADPGPD